MNCFSLHDDITISIKIDGVNMGERIADRMKRLAAESKASSPASAASADPKQNIELQPEAKPIASGSDAERRARTHRLIEVGAICDQYLGTKGMSPQEVIELLARISRVEEVRTLIK